MEAAILRERHEGAFPPEAIFSNSVREALYGLLGDSATKSLCYHLDLGEAYVGPGALKKRLGEIMGEGAVILERAIVMEFYRELRLPYEVTLRLDPSPDAVSSSFDFEALVATGMQMHLDSEKRRRDASPLLQRER